MKSTAIKYFYLVFMIKNNSILIYLFAIPTLLFFLIFDYKILDTSYLDWFWDDTYQHWLGWSFYRSTDLFQFPLLSNYSFGMKSAGSLVYSDSIPILSILFRPFSSFLDFHFQYFGFWVLASVILQYIVSFKIMKIFSSNLLFNLISACFFVISPVLIYRFNVGHESLTSQWLILMALYFHLKKDKTSDKSWLFLILFSLLVHAYFFAMILIIYFIELSKRYFTEKEKFLLLSKKLVTAIISSLLLMYILGYFTIEDVFHGGYGGYRSNLLSLINPYANLFTFSSLIPKYSFFELNKIGDHEGFAYLGLGILVMSFAIIVLSIYKFKYSNFLSSIKEGKYLLALSFIIIIFSLSNKIALGPYEIFQYNVPEVFKVFTSPYRASGRMIWPVYYLIYIIVLSKVFVNFKPKKSIVILLSCLLLTVYDIKDHIGQSRSSRGSVEVSKIEERNFKDKKWKIFAKKYASVSYVFPVYAPVNWKEISYFAVKNGMSTNGGYWARHNEIAEFEYSENIKKEIENDAYNVDTLYYFNDDEYWELAKKNSSSRHFIGKVDNYRILAPNYFLKK